MPSSRESARTVDGNNVLYHYLQKGLLQSDVWLFQMLTARLVASLGVWLPIEVYRAMPVLVPHAVRDSTCRKDAKTDRPEAWGSPDRQGFFRDDNSLIKGLPSSLSIRSPFALYNGARMGAGFVASHVWRIRVDGTLASRNNLTNSFVPNLVWLPSQVAKLTDREGSFVQTYLQAMSIKIYREAAILQAHRATVAAAWDALPDPIGVPLQGLPRLDDLNFFAPTDAFVAGRLRALRAVRELLANALRGLPGPSVSRRYNGGLATVDPVLLRHLADFVDEYVQAVESDSPTNSR